MLYHKATALQITGLPFGSYWTNYHRLNPTVSSFLVTQNFGLTESTSTRALERALVLPVAIPRTKLTALQVQAEAEFTERFSGAVSFEYVVVKGRFTSKRLEANSRICPDTDLHLQTMLFSA